MTHHENRDRQGLAAGETYLIHVLETSDPPGNPDHYRITDAVGRRRRIAPGRRQNQRRRRLDIQGPAMVFSATSATSRPPVVRPILPLRQRGLP